MSRRALTLDETDAGGGDPGGADSGDPGVGY